MLSRFKLYFIVLFALAAAQKIPAAASFAFNGHGSSTRYKRRIGLGIEYKYFSSYKFAAISGELADHEPSYYQSLVRQFQGDFDNYNQVVEDRKRGLLPAEGGGHEHIHCTLVPCPRLQCEGSRSEEDQWVIAAFYLNGNPKQIFRFRMYCMIPPQHAGAEKGDSPESVRLKLHTLNPELDQCLRGCSEQPWTWWKEVYNLWLSFDQNDAHTELDQWQRFQFVGIPKLVSQLKGCDVLWNPDWNPSNHSYLYVDEYDEMVSPSDTLPDKKAFHATMEAGPDGVIVDSISMIPGKRILIKDELSLWENEFWINDRGYDPDADVMIEPQGAHNMKDSGGLPYVYGNRRGIPYKLERVASMINKPKSQASDAEIFLTLQREIINSELEWTLGESYRTLELYQQKLDELEVD